MPFRPCYSRVGPLPEPDVCYCCVGRRSRRARASDQACLPAARRPAAAGDRLGQPPVQLPLRPGREGRTVTNETYTDKQTTHNAESACAGRHLRAGGTSMQIR
jgi:hypothetical protein